MKIFNILLFQLFILSACNADSVEAFKSNNINSAPDTLTKQILSAGEKCITLYQSKQVWVLEQNCPDKNIQQGIYIADSLGTRSFAWYDAPFNNWAWNEGCNSEKDCYYKITVNSKGEATDLVYYFFINLSEGYFKIKIKNNQLIISEKKIVDHPS